MGSTIRFMAFGDSLTVGFTSSDFPANYPYTFFLKQIVDSYLKESGRAGSVEFLNMGINGELTSDMLLRFRRDVVDPHPNNVIVLGGTNDLGWGVPVEEIFDNLKRMYRMAIEDGVAPIGCTIPSIIGWDDGIRPRLELNESLKGYCLPRGIPCVDIFQATCEPGTLRLRPDYSSDGLHLNAGGYRKMAETIFQEAVRNVLDTLDRR